MISDEDKNRHMIQQMQMQIEVLHKNVERFENKANHNMSLY